MAFEEVTSTGWFGRIGESIKGILFGLVLLVVAPVVLVMNERNAVRDVQANNEIGKKVLSVESEMIDGANEGKLVHLNGSTETEDILKNKEFGIEEQAIRISWTALIYQWVESKESKTKKKLGGGEEKTTTYTYEKEWVDSPVSSSDFKEAGHENRGKQIHRSGSQQAKNVNLGAFDLPTALIGKIASSEVYQLGSMPPSLAKNGRLTGGIFHTGSLESPKVGDEKVSFTITRPGDVSVMAVQKGDSFAPYVAKNGKKKFLLYEGLLSAEEVVQGEEGKAKVLRWILRVVGIVVMFVGLILIMRPLSVLADVVPLFGSLVGGATGVIAFIASLGFSFVIIAISWITFRPLIGIPLLLVAIACFALVIKKMIAGKRQAQPA